MLKPPLIKYDSDRRPIYVRVGISFVNAANARASLDGERKTHDQFLARSGYWRNVFNPNATPEAGYMQDRHGGRRARAGVLRNARSVAGVRSDRLAHDQARRPAERLVSHRREPRLLQP